MVFDLTEEQRMIQDMARSFAQKEVLPKAAELDETGRFPEELVRQMAGGAELDELTHELESLSASE